MIIKISSQSKRCFLSLTLLLIVPLTLFCQFQHFAESYNLLSTVAGTGESDDRSEIGWLADFENGSALDAELTRPHFAMADSSGNIYIADKDAHAIRKVSTTGIITTIAGTNIAGDSDNGLGIENQLNSPNGIWVKDDGTVYILDLGNNKIKRLGTDGNLETIIDDENGISSGLGLWVTPSEDTIFYSSATQIKIWTKSSGIGTYSSGYSGLANITMDKNGYLIATDKSANLVYRISKDGNINEIIAGNGSRTGGGDGFLATETGLEGVRGIWFLEDNSYFVATHQGSQIWYVDAEGRIYIFLDGKNGDSYHSGDGENYRTPGYKISEPRSVSVDYEGNVLIVENDFGYVRRIENEYIYYYTSMIQSTNRIKDIVVYPNPANTKMTINYQLNKPGLVRLTLLNNLGEKLMSIEKEVLNDRIQSMSVNTSKFVPGVYYCKVSTSESESIQKTLIYR